MGCVHAESLSHQAVRRARQQGCLSWRLFLMFWRGHVLRELIVCLLVCFVLLS
jgi:hypothetical protein